MDAFLRNKGLNSYRIIKKEAGIIPVSGIQKLVQYNIASIGDSASMPNPLSGGGLTSIVYAAQVLARHISNLKNYEWEVKKQPIAAPALWKARQVLLGLADKDVVNPLSFLTEPHHGKVKFPSVVRILKYPSLILELKALISVYQAVRISKDYGW